MKLPKLTTPKMRSSAGNGNGNGNGRGGRKVPKAISDVYEDLKDRRLLPLVALLLVAIVAAPILLSNKGEEEELPPIPAPKIGAASAPASFSVVPAKEQLRDYRKRLGHRKATSPFSTYAADRLSNEDREFVEDFLKGDEESGGESESSSGEAPVETFEPPVEQSEPQQPETVVTPQPKVTVKAQIGVLAVVESSFNEIRDPKVLELKSQERLPNKDRPAVVYAGPSSDGKGALFLMTEEVTAYYGHGRCVLGSNPCQELELRLGKSATFALGYGETRYKLRLLGFKPLIEEKEFEIER
jgi:hypothetical protein